MIYLNIGIGEIAVSSDPDEVIRTYALGSCLAVMSYDQKNKVAGMVHIALPESQTNASRATNLPGYFADTGIPALIKKMQIAGADIDNLWIKMAGGARVLESINYFDIGKKNILATNKILWQMKLPIIKKDIGGNISRTVSFSSQDGSIEIKNKDRIWKI